MTAFFIIALLFENSRAVLGYCRCIPAFPHAVVTQYVGYAYPVVRKYFVSSLRLGLAMSLDVPPGLHGFFVTPER